ncbi:MAG TPA: molybdenum cofactor biosynthesis protein MoaE [Rariglobus sp.]|jgi:molybdopterin synthase catalytic subunit|nr:molybdenum cofactor biosynthesis protein MoaE [Rariglobus sp.]
MSFQISSAPLDLTALKAGLADAHAGACVTFEGWVRDHNDGRPVQALDYEAYGLLAEKEGARIVAEALEKFPITRVVCVHRTGALKIGDLAVWVGVCSAHRGAAFDACRYLIDEVKARVPVWKKEHYADGSTEWINCATRGDHA